MKRDYFGLKGAPTSPNGNGNLGQDLGNIRAKLKNRIFEDSFGKQALTHRSRGRTRRGSRPSAPRAPDGQELLAPLAADGLPVEAGIGRACDGLGLAALLGADAGISAGGVDQRQNRNPETVRHLHQPLRLAISLRPRHAEIVLEAAFGRRALLMPDDADAFAAKAAEATDDRDVVAEFAVAG